MSCIDFFLHLEFRILCLQRVRFSFLLRQLHLFRFNRLYKQERSTVEWIKTTEIRLLTFNQLYKIGLWAGFFFRHRFFTPMSRLLKNSGNFQGQGQFQRPERGSRASWTFRSVIAPPAAHLQTRLCWRRHQIQIWPSLSEGQGWLSWKCTVEAVRLSTRWSQKSYQRLFIRLMQA